MVLIALLACSPELPTAERPVVVASSRELDFGWIEQGGAATQELVLRNDGGLPFGVHESTLLRPEHALGGGFTVEGLVPGAIVAPGEEIVATVSLSPAASRCEDTLYIWFDEDGETTWFDREHPWMAIRLGGNGVGLPPATEPSPSFGSVVPERTGVEQGGTIAMEAIPREPLTYAWNVPYGQGGHFEPNDEASVVWHAPDQVDNRGGVVHHIEFMAWAAQGDAVLETLRVRVYQKGEIREPVYLTESP
jgi:hypothetical protein